MFRGAACVAEGERALVLLPDGTVGVVLDTTGDARAWHVDATGAVHLEGQGAPVHACHPFFEGMPVRYRGAGPATGGAPREEEPVRIAETLAAAEARADAAVAEAAALLEELGAARTRIEDLEREVERLARERVGVGRAPRMHPPHVRLFEQVGLHPECPDHLLEAAQRSFRRHLHPDRYPPEQRASADAEFRAMEATFHEIRELRRGRARS